MGVGAFFFSLSFCVGVARELLVLLLYLDIVQM
jgi:hypothetical protein